MKTTSICPKMLTSTVIMVKRLVSAGKLGKAQGLGFNWSSVISVSARTVLFQTLESKQEALSTAHNAL